MPINLPPLVPAAVVHISSAVLRVAVARTPDDQARGLKFRDSVDACDGMLFVFDDPGLYAFWMHEVRIALDVAWLDSRRRVVATAERLPPCFVPPCAQYTPPAPGRYVLEVPGGVLRQLGIGVGDVATIEWL